LLLAVTLRSPRALFAAIACAALLALPFVGAGRAVLGSTGEFARRWRGNDGVYAGVQAATDRIVCRALGAPRARPEGTPCTVPVDLWPHQGLATLISGRPSRAAVYPDELSSFLARAFVGLALLALLAWLTLLRHPTLLDGTEWLLGALILLSPTVHPWYATWLLPIAALKRRAAWIALAALLPLAYVPLGAWLGGAPWRDPIWTRAIEHGTCWALLGGQAWRCRRQIVDRSLGSATIRQ
jgi:hypothetical protein